MADTREDLRDRYLITRAPIGSTVYASPFFVEACAHYQYLHGYNGPSTRLFNRVQQGVVKKHSTFSCIVGTTSERTVELFCHEFVSRANEYTEPYITIDDLKELKMHEPITLLSGYDKRLSCTFLRGDTLIFTGIGDVGTVSGILPETNERIFVPICFIAPLTAPSHASHAHRI